ncbi:MAG TPA: DNA repair protein RecO [Rhodanobacteraceae bacterium]
MLIVQQPAYILHTRPYRETSLLLECLTRDHGRLGMVARGVRRGRGVLSASVLQAFQPLSLSFTLRGELGTLRAAEPEQAPRLLEGTALLAGLYVNELMVRLSARQDPQPGLFAIYVRALQALDQQPETMAWALRCFERDMLEVLGYAMPLREDADTGAAVIADAEYLYVPEHGPVAAASGQPGLRVRGSDLLGLADDRQPDASGQERLRRLLRGVLLHRLGGVPLRSWQVFGGARQPSRHD